MASEPKFRKVLMYDSNGSAIITTEIPTIDDGATTTNVTYIGYPLSLSTATSDAEWRILKLDDTVSGITTPTWADGDKNFDNVWDDRASLSYS